MPAKPRVIVLGGGIGALSAAWQITSQPDWQQKFSGVCVYQPGWRLGGKCASSRNPDIGWRNEEHGLHMWFGFYENAFRMMRACYRERQGDAAIARPAGSPLETIDQAFKGYDDVTLMEPDGPGWRRLGLHFRQQDGDGEPGDGEYLEPGPYDILRRLTRMLHEQAQRCMPDMFPWDEHFLDELPLLGRAQLQMAAAPRRAQGGGEPAGKDSALLFAGDLFDFLPSPAEFGAMVFGELGDLFDRMRGAARALWNPGPEPDCPDFAQVGEMLELGFTVLRGLVVDRVLTEGLRSIDDREFRRWLDDHGADRDALMSTPVRALYSAALAYEDGDLNRPNMAAGVALGLLLRIGLCWRGHATYEMQAGMGETVIAPLYQVLKQRGVEFRFFHRVTALKLAGQRIGEIEFGIEADVTAGRAAYEPLIAVGPTGLPCWPPRPLHAQLDQGAALRLGDIDLESPWSGWADVGRETLVVGSRDHVVLGISLGALAPISRELADRDPGWKAMLEGLPLVETQSAQLWLDRPLQQLGWVGAAAAMVAAPEPHNVWADMSQLLATEDWGASPPQASVYLCGPLAGNFGESPAADLSTPARARAAVRTETIRWLQNYGGWVWPGVAEMQRAAHPDERPLHWEHLHVPPGFQGPGPMRIDHQWLCANIGGSARYVLSPAGNNALRRAPEASGFTRLWLAGDWTQTSINAGCVEAAVMSGLAAGRAVLGQPGIPIDNEHFLQLRVPRGRNQPAAESTGVNRKQDRADGGEGSGGAAVRADWHRIFEPMSGERDYEVRDIEGHLPPDLIGTLYRNGPGKWETGTRHVPFQHVFDGDGMLSEYTLTGRRLRYRNRYVRTPQYKAGLHHPGITLRAGGTQRPGGPLANALRLPANAANTNVILHAERLLMLWEAGRPFELHPETLETVGEHDFGGRLHAFSAFSAHPKRDPDTGDWYNFGLDLLPWPCIRCYRLEPHGGLRQLRAVPIPRLVFNHDFGLTRRYMVFVLDPIVADVPSIALGLDSVDRLLHFRRQLGTTFLLVPRDGGPVRRIEHEALMHFHINNAWEEGDDVVVELMRWDEEWDVLNQTLRDFRTTSSNSFGSRLCRYRIRADGRVSAEVCCEHLGELPQHDHRRTGKRILHSYFAAKLANGRAAVIKVDRRRGGALAHELPQDHVVGEPVFVPRDTRHSAEDDGWLLAVAYDPQQHRSRLLILDAKDPSRAPLAVGHLQHHVPQDLHGMFTPRIARSA